MGALRLRPRAARGRTDVCAVARSTHRMRQVTRSLAGSVAHVVTTVLALINPIVAVVFFFIAAAFIFAERPAVRLRN